MALAARIPAGTPVLLTCSDTDRQALCNTMKPLIDALAHTALTVVELKGVNHVLRSVASADRAANVATYGDATLPNAPSVAATIAAFVKR